MHTYNHYDRGTSGSPASSTFSSGRTSGGRSVLWMSTLFCVYIYIRSWGGVRIPTRYIHVRINEHVRACVCLGSASMHRHPLPYHLSLSTPSTNTLHAIHPSQMLAYMFFTPCFRDGRVIGYQANILRRDPKIAKCVLQCRLYMLVWMWVWVRGPFVFVYMYVYIYMYMWGFGSLCAREEPRAPEAPHADPTYHHPKPTPGRPTRWTSCCSTATTPSRRRASNSSPSPSPRSTVSGRTAASPACSAAPSGAFCRGVRNDRCTHTQIH